MLTYLIILLDNTSTSYCHYKVTAKERQLIRLDDLKLGILYAMKENLNVQFVYPDYPLPEEYNDVIESIDHIKIKPESQAIDANVVILDNWKVQIPDMLENITCVIHAKRGELVEYHERLIRLFSQVSRLNIVLTDIDNFSDSDIDAYKDILDSLADDVLGLYLTGKNLQVNLLTDRMMLMEMNNCNAGVDNVTLAPNGKFYLCPAFYYEDSQNDVGDLCKGLTIKNQQLLRLDHAPICRNCDAYQCKRCIWLNGKLTLDYNTPSHQQCVLAHLERNASRKLQVKLGERGVRLSNTYKIEELTELDPFNIVNRWK